MATIANAQQVEIVKKGGGATVRRSSDNMVSNFDPSLATVPLRANDLCFDRRRGALYRWNTVSWQPFFGWDDGQQADVPYTVSNPASNIATGWDAALYNKMLVHYTIAGPDTMRIATPTNVPQTIGEIFVVDVNMTSRTMDADTLLIHFDSLFRTYDGHLINEWKCPPRGRVQMAFRVHIAVEGNQWVEVDDILGSYQHGGGGGGGVTPAVISDSLDNVTLQRAYDNSGATPKMVVDGNGSSNGLEIETTGTNPITIDLSNGTGDFKIQNLDGVAPIYHTFRENGQAVLGYGSATGDITPFATTILPRLQIGSNISNNAYVMLAAANNSGFVMQNVGTANINAQFASYSSRGSFTSPAFLSDNDPLMQVSSYGWGGGANTTFVKGAGIQWYAQGAHGFTNRSQKIRVWTLTSGTSSPVDRFEFADRNIALVAFQTNAAKYEKSVTTVTTTGTYTVLSTDEYIRIDATTGVQTHTLPSGAIEDGRVLKFKRIDNNPTTSITFTGTVDGLANPNSLMGGSPIGDLAVQYGKVVLRYNSTLSAWEVW